MKVSNMKRAIMRLTRQTDKQVEFKIKKTNETCGLKRCAAMEVIYDKALKKMEVDNASTR